ncbi:MAG TPA: hypothetical protein VH374_04995 [Polyangia bacterium]|jgi:hypothetical protein|nr:hypothetical protein [Polyangia bacterium]
MTRPTNQLALSTPTAVTFTGTARATTAEGLRSPVSGLPCVHWRLRVVENMTANLQLVHELASPEMFEVSWARAGEADPGRPAVRVRVDPRASRIQAAPVLHRPGTPGALAAARHLGLAGLVSVEEVLIREGESLEAEGFLEAPPDAEGPFRAIAGEPELLDAIVRLESRSLGPTLLPWALGTAAALLGVMGGATYAAWRYHVLHLPAGTQHLPRLFMPRPELRPPEIPHPRLP